MLIYISESMATAIEQNDGEAIEALELVAQSMFYGHHFVYSSRALLQRIAQAPGIESKSKIIINHLWANYATLGSIIQHVSFYCELTHSTQGMELHRTTQHTVLRLPHHYYLRYNLSLASSTRILVENSEDAGFYLHVANWFQSTTNRGRLTLSHSPESGGGNTTAEVFRKYVDEPVAFCLCIATPTRNTQTQKKEKPSKK